MKRCKPGIRTALLLTGNEILSGDIIDTNSTFIAREFLPAGIKINRKIVVGDDLDTIIEAMTLLAETNDVVIVNGGLGATVDDLTAEAVSKITGRPLEENTLAVENIRLRYGRSFSTENTTYFKHLRKQALLPSDVTVLPNPVGLAVGFKVKIDQAMFYFTPGVPKEMKAMIRESILPDIVSNFTVNPALITRKFKVIGTGESRTQQLINQHIPEATWNRIDLGFRASTAMVEVKLSIKEEAAKALLAKTEEKIRSIFSHQIASQGESLPEVIVQLLARKKARLGVLENCSAGQITALINSTAGGTGALVTGLCYQKTDELTNLFGPDQETDGVCNQSSSPVLNEILAARFLAKSRADIVLATSQAEVTSGIESDRPCKKLIVSCGTNESMVSREFMITREYDDFLAFVSIAALDMLRRFVSKFPTDTPYYFDELTRNQLK